MYTCRLKLLTHWSYIAQNYKGGMYFFHSCLHLNFKTCFRSVLLLLERKSGLLTTLIIMGQSCVLWTATMLFHSHSVEHLDTHPGQFSPKDIPAAHRPVKNYHPLKISPTQTHQKFATHRTFPCLLYTSPSPRD